MPDRIDPLHQQGTHHWLITLDGIGSRSGTCDWPADETRYDLYLRIRAEVLDAEHCADGPVPPTLFFDLQENSISKGRREEAEEDRNRDAASSPLPGHR
ncbi:hypothetical protein [Streptomyces sp. NPDC008240]|uniref:hypothetical protein n=1 Tax=Streptomyces sp. NPDC008240 TaxID=3364822 RepID=UPI0036E7B4C5